MLHLETDTYLHISDSQHTCFQERFRNLKNEDVLGKTNQNPIFLTVDF